MEIWRTLFKDRWAPLVAGLVIAFANTMMFVVESPWSVYAGLRNWGLHLLEMIPGVPDVAQISPLEYTSSVMDISFLFGAFAAALLAKEFAVRFPPRRELIKGILGGILMGIGATLSRGCTVGGFYSSIAALSASGLFMMIGLFIGTVAGLKILLLEKRFKRPPSSGGMIFHIPETVQVVAGAVVLLAGLFAIPYLYGKNDMEELGTIFALAVVIGVANQRSRFCIARAFREPFMTGDGAMTKAVAGTFVVTIIGFSILKFYEIAEPMDHIAPSSGWPAIIGGFIFGLGMMFAGGCASGSLWRFGEGHVKLAVAVLFFALSAAATHVILQLYLEYSYVKRVFLPEFFNSWYIALAIPIGVIYLWYWVASWNERTEKLVIYK